MPGAPRAVRAGAPGLAGRRAAAGSPLHHLSSRTPADWIRPGTRAVRSDCVWDSFCATSQARDGGDMSAKHAVLGLLIERPGYGYQLARRLDERFGSSAFAPSCVYSALDQLIRDELVRELRSTDPGPARRGGQRIVYEATARGV